MNRLFVANKPSGISSNFFLSQLKRKYGVKKAGFSGTLDPFASGVLVVAFGNYSRLFRFLNLSPKRYKATIWLGASSSSLDSENISKVLDIKPFKLSQISQILIPLKGQITYTPPKFSAKKVAGKRAYELARSGVEFELKKEIMEVFDLKLLSYMHPFLTIELSVSKGAYVRSFAQILAQNLGVIATLSSLERLSEGEFKFEDEKELNPLDFISLQENFYNLEAENILLGKKLDIRDFKIHSDGAYLVKIAKFISVLEFKNGEISYLLNRFEI